MILLLLVLSVSCSGDGGGDDEPSPQELTFEKLSGSWALNNGGSITLDGRDVSGNYPGFTLSFTDGGYATTNAGDLFNASGTWNWASETTTNQILLDDGKSIAIQNLSTTQFKFSFAQSDGGVRAGVAGNYTVMVNK